MQTLRVQVDAKSEQPEGLPGVQDQAPTERQVTELPQRFWDKVQKTETCWIWTGAQCDGYGRFGVTNGKMRRAHRLAYEALVGQIPDDLTLDHLCRNRACINPAHLEPVRLRTNVLRGIGASARNARKTQCKHGHPFTPENTYNHPDGSRVCRTCKTRIDHTFAQDHPGRKHRKKS